MSRGTESQAGGYGCVELQLICHDAVATTPDSRVWAVGIPHTNYNKDELILG